MILLKQTQRIDINISCDLPEMTSTAEDRLNNQMDKITLPVAISFFSCSMEGRSANRLG